MNLFSFRFSLESKAVKASVMSRVNFLTEEMNPLSSIDAHLNDNANDSMPDATPDSSSNATISPSSARSMNVSVVDHVTKSTTSRSTPSSKLQKRK